jgi:Tol biopolymer transport system component
VWSPDGRHVSYGRSGNSDQSSIWVADAETGESRLAAQFPRRFHIIFRAGWSRDGKSLIVNRNQPVSSIVLLENFLWDRPGGLSYHGGFVAGTG